MRISSKYSIGEIVYRIRNAKTEVKDTCQTCLGKTTVVINNTPPRTCPDCYGRGYKSSWEPTQWKVHEPLTIAQVRVEVTGFRPTVCSNMGTLDSNFVKEVKYMCLETGVGSGTLHRENDLFRDEKDALKECEKRNKKKEADSCH